AAAFGRDGGKGGRARIAHRDILVITKILSRVMYAKRRYGAPAGAGHHFRRSTVAGLLHPEVGGRKNVHKTTDRLGSRRPFPGGLFAERKRSVGGAESGTGGAKRARDGGAAGVS